MKNLHSLFHFVSILAICMVFSSCETKSSDLEYWSKVMKENPENEQLNAFSFEEKYKIIEHAFNKIGLSSNYSYEEIAGKLKKESSVSDYLFDEKIQINQLSYWVLGLWGSHLNFPNEERKFNYQKLSDQIWFFEGEQGDIKYGDYVKILEKMRPSSNPIRNWKEVYVEETNNYEIDFDYGIKKLHWDISNEVGGSINNQIFKEYTNFTSAGYLKRGNYFLIMEGGGGYAMFLSYQAEKYLRTLWNFPKLNKKGMMMTLNAYGEL